VERTPEPELMDDERQAVAYSEADFTAAHERFVALCEAFVGRDGLAGTVLDLGCGPCDVTVRLARRFPRAVFHGVDGAEAMLALGRARVERAGLGGRIRLARALLPHDPPPLDRYDAVVSNSLLHHLHDPSVLWAAVARRARAGAPVVVMDLRRPDSPQAARALVDAYAGGEPEVLRRDFYDSLRAAFTPEEVRAQVAAAGLGLDVRAVGDRHLVAQGRR
jgi:ubiquinone/menaquinone biosynthesis C-methylase UbiE